MGGVWDTLSTFREGVGENIPGGKHVTHPADCCDRGWGQVKDRIQGVVGLPPPTWAAVGGCWAGDSKVTLGRLDWYSRAGWIRRVEE